MASFLQGDNKVVFFIASFKEYKLKFIIYRIYIPSLSLPNLGKDAPPPP